MPLRTAALASLAIALGSAGSGPAHAGPDVRQSFVCGDSLSFVIVMSIEDRGYSLQLIDLEPRARNGCLLDDDQFHPEGCMIDSVSVWLPSAAGQPPLVVGDTLLARVRPHGPPPGSPDQITCSSEGEATEAAPVPRLIVDAMRGFQAWIAPPRRDPWHRSTFP